MIALFTGARLNEICSLYVEDVVSIDDILCININEKTKDKHAKSPAGVRKTPLHPILIEAGFLRYVEKMKAKGEERLWPKLTFTKGNGYAGTFGNWYSKYNREYITQDKDKTFHSLRHNLTANLKIHHVPEELRMEIDGHKNSQQAPMQKRYGGKFPVNVMYNDGIMKLDYGLDFSGIRYPVD